MKSMLNVNSIEIDETHHTSIIFDADALINRNSFRLVVRFGAIIIEKGRQRVQRHPLVAMHVAVQLTSVTRIWNQSFSIIARLQSKSTFKVGYLHTHTHTLWLPPQNNSLPIFFASDCLLQYTIIIAINSTVLSFGCRN